MGRIQLITKPESTPDDAPTILRIEADAEGVAALRAVLAAVQSGGEGTSRKVEADVWVNGDLLPTFLTTVQEVDPLRRRTLTRDVVIALVIILACLAVVVSAFFFAKNGPTATTSHSIEGN